jgi:hypothetical protein
MHGVTVKDVEYQNRVEVEKFYSDEEILDLFPDDEGSLVNALLRRAQAAENDNWDLREHLKVPNPARDFVNECNDILKLKNNNIELLQGIIANLCAELANDDARHRLIAQQAAEATARITGDNK